MKHAEPAAKPRTAAYAFRAPRGLSIEVENERHDPFGSIVEVGRFEEGGG